MLTDGGYEQCQMTVVDGASLVIVGSEWGRRLWVAEI